MSRHIQVAFLPGRFLLNQDYLSAHFSHILITLTNFCLSNLAYGFAEKIIKELLDLSQILNLKEQQITRFIGCGNTIRKSSLLRRVIEKHTNLPLFIPSHKGETALRAAILAWSVLISEEIEVLSSRVLKTD